MASGEDPEELLRTPGRMATARIAEYLDHVGGSLMGTAVRPARLIPKAEVAFGLEAIDPFVAGLPADPELFAELDHGEESPVVVGDEAVRLSVIGVGPLQLRRKA